MTYREDDTTHFGSKVAGGAHDDNYNAVLLQGGATAVSPKVKPIGDDTNVGLRLGVKGTAQVASDERITQKFTVSTVTTAGAVTYTAAQLLGGLILRDPAGAGRSDVTPTAALIIAALPGYAVGDSFEFTIRNDADAAETITLTAGTGVTLSGTMTIAQSNSKRFLCRVASASAVTIYSLGTVVH